jgi:hypothetical protein
MGLSIIVYLFKGISLLKPLAKIKSHNYTSNLKLPSRNYQIHIKQKPTINLILIILQSLLSIKIFQELLEFTALNASLFVE